MIKIPYANSIYSDDDLLNALEKHGYSKDDAKIIVQYGYMTENEQRFFVSSGKLSLLGTSESRIKSIFIEAQNRKKVHDKHNEIINQARIYVSRYSEEAQEFISELDSVKSMANAYYAGSPTGISLTRKEATLLAVKKFFVMKEGAAQVNEKKAYSSPLDMCVQPAPTPEEPQGRAENIQSQRRKHCHSPREREARKGEMRVEVQRELQKTPKDEMFPSNSKLKETLRPILTGMSLWQRDVFFEVLKEEKSKEPHRVQRGGAPAKK